LVATLASISESVPILVVVQFYQENSFLIPQYSYGIEFFIAYHVEYRSPHLTSPHLIATRLTAPIRSVICTVSIFSIETFAREQQQQQQQQQQNSIPSVF
jgi:hypothetical protein